MFKSLKTAVAEWSQRTSDREKLQHTYIALLIVDVFLAGLVSLFNRTRSHELLLVAYALLIALMVNFFVWALLKTTVLDKLTRPTPRGGGRTTRR